MRVWVIALMFAGCAPKSDLRRWYAQGLDAQRAGRTTEARASFEKLLATEQGAEGAHNSLAVLDMEDGNAESALAHLAEELKRHPSLTAARINEAVVLYLKGDFAGARQKALSAVGSFPDEAHAHLALGLALVALGEDVGRAEEALSRAIELGDASSRAPAHFARGVLRARQGRIADSAEDFRAVTLLRQDAVAHYNRSLMLAESAKLEEALGAVRLAAAVDADAAAIPHLEAILLVRLQRPAEAREALAAAEKREPKRPGLRLLAGLLFAHDKKWADAALAFREETERSPASADAWFDLGLAQVETGDLAGARASFDRAASLDPKDKGAAKNRDALAKVLAP